SLMGIPAIVYRGDSLRNTMTERWFTPFHIIWGWNHKLRSTETGPHEVPLISEALRSMSEAEKAALDLIAAEALPDVPAAIADGAQAMIEVEDNAMTTPDLPAIAGNFQLHIAPGTSPPYD